MTAYDWLLARRTAALGLVLGAFVFLVMMGTDDPTGTHGGRLGRLAALASVAGGGAAFMATAQARSRGEIRALVATGVEPLRASIGAVIGGTVVGAAGAVLALLPGVDLAPLFPRALPFGGGWTLQGSEWLDPAHGVVVYPDGSLGAVSAVAGAGASSATSAATATVVALLVAALGLPLWATAKGAPYRRGVVAFLAAAAAVLVFHLVAAEWVSGALLAVPPLILFFDAVALHRRTTWS